jgi:hypothetical protein
VLAAAWCCMQGVFSCVVAVLYWMWTGVPGTARMAWWGQLLCCGDTTMYYRGSCTWGLGRFATVMLGQLGHGTEADGSCVCASQSLPFVTARVNRM